nr:MAG TPA: hypothetical protein [Caudoviricetes sp.]
MKKLFTFSKRGGIVFSTKGKRRSHHEVVSRKPD